MPHRVHVRRALSIATFLAGLAGAAPPALGFVATALLREDGPLPGAPAGHFVDAISNTGVNHAGGYSATVNSSNGATVLSHVWGNATGGPGSVMRTEGTFGPLVQTSFESFYGISNAGEVSYSPIGTGGPVGGFDSVWLEDAPVALEGNPIPTLPGLYWRFASRPGVTAYGAPYWVGGTTNTPGGATQNYGLFYGAGATVALLGGQAVPGLPFPLGMSSSIDFDYRYSALGTHNIVPVLMASGSTANDAAIVVDGSGLMVGGSLVREGSPVPAAAGGLPAENWGLLDFTGITETGEYFFTGNTSAATGVDEIVVKNGAVLYREGSVVDGRTLTGDMEGAYINEQADVAYIWDVTAVPAALEALYVNSSLVLLEGATVDLTGDGVVEPTSHLADFTGISALTMSDRDGAGVAKCYFTADVDTAGTASATDDIEGFFCLAVQVGQPTAVTGLFSLQALPAAESIEILWGVRSREEYIGFHVHRAADGGPFLRLTSELIPNVAESYPATLSWVDEDVEPGVEYAYKIEVIHSDGTPEVWEQAIRASALGSSPLGFALRVDGPNPARTSVGVAFAYAVPQPGADVTIQVFDVAGRRVASLVEGRVPPGEYTARWNPQADGAAGSGVYFVRMDAAGFGATERVVLVR